MTCYDFFGVEGEEKLRKLWAQDHTLIGPSPGGAAAALNCTRNYIFDLGEQGKLDIFRVYKARWARRPSEVYVSAASLERYKVGVLSGRIIARDKIKKHIARLV